MKAVVYHSPKDIRVDDIPEPKVSGKKVLVKFKAGSICGTDLHFYRGEWKIKTGRIMGHDACGVREDTHERVVMVPTTYCGTCYFCLRGLPVYCERFGQHRGIDRNGFFAELIAIHPKYLIPISDDITDDEAGTVEPVALAIRVMELLKPHIGDYATIIGQGPIGLLMMQVAKLKGCRIIAVDPQAYRLDYAKHYGAEYCINPEKEDVIKRVKEITGRGSDVVIEAAGKTRAVEETPFIVRKAGRVALVGEFKGRMNFSDADDVCFFTTYVSPIEYPLAIQLIARKEVDVKGLITHRFRLADFMNAIRIAENPSEKPLKIIIKN